MRDNSDSESDRNRGIQHSGMCMSLYIGTQNKAIAINFRRIGILCLPLYSLSISVQIFHFIYISHGIVQQRR